MTPLPSIASLHPPGAEMGDLVGRDEPSHNILEEPQEDLAVQRRVRLTGTVRCHRSASYVIVGAPRS